MVTRARWWFDTNTHKTHTIKLTINMICPTRGFSRGKIVKALSRAGGTATSYFYSFSRTDGLLDRTRKNLVSMLPRDETVNDCDSDVKAS